MNRETQILKEYAEKHYNVKFSELGENAQGYYLSMAWYDLYD